MTDTTFSVPPLIKVLPNQEVHVWQLKLDRSLLEIGRFYETLSAAEQAKAASFFFLKDRIRFIIVHGSLRIILSAYLNIPPTHIRFGSTPFGKPTLVDEQRIQGDKIQFNLTHSGGFALISIARNRRVGIDIERIRPEVDCDPLISRFFSQSEKEVLQSLPIESRNETFFNYWVLKEAFIKGVGQGLSIPLDNFSICFSPGEYPSLQAPTGETMKFSQWSLRILHPSPDYIGALAVEGETSWYLKILQLDDGLTRLGKSSVI